MAILITIIGLGIMVLVHELGHFICAKRFNVLVHEFSIGMGPKLFSFGKGETKYSLRLLPLGGYVKLEGEGAEESNNPRSFSNLTPFKRIIVLVSGALMNLILGWLIFAVVNLNVGITPAVVREISPDYKNVQTVLEPGDEILKLNSSSIHTYDDVSLFMSRFKGGDINIKYKRDGKVFKEAFTPIKENGRYLLGITFMPQKATVLSSAKYALYDTIYTSKAVFLAVGDLITGRQGLDSLSGPVEIVSVIDTVTSSQNQSGYTLLSILLLFAMITVNLGIFNLLPFPALDGGSIIFNLYELIFRKKIKQEIVGYVGFIGFALLMLLAVYVTVGDIRALIK